MKNISVFIAAILVAALPIAKAYGQTSLTLSPNPVQPVQKAILEAQPSHIAGQSVQKAILEAQPSHIAGQSFNIDNVAISKIDKEALARVAMAEAGNQGAAGIAGVIYVILNRVASGRFGPNIQTVINAQDQFEPVMNSGGSWENLPALTSIQQEQFDTIFNLIFNGFMPDPTHGALYFQNPTIVADRVEDGTDAASLLNFGGSTPTAIIKDQSFYYLDKAVDGSINSVQEQNTLTPETAGIFASNKINQNDATSGGQVLFVPLQVPFKQAASSLLQPGLKKSHATVLEQTKDKKISNQSSKPQPSKQNGIENGGQGLFVAVDSKQS